MGVESYLIKLISQQNTATISRALLTIHCVEADEKQLRVASGDSYYVFNDSKHVIEFELAERVDHSQLSVRFAICHPASIASVFIEIVTQLMSQSNMTTTICEELPIGAPGQYRTSESALFQANCRWSISAAREQWRKQFGDEEAALSISDACRKFYFEDISIRSG